MQMEHKELFFFARPSSSSNILPASSYTSNWHNQEAKIILLLKHKHAKKRKNGNQGNYWNLE